MTAETESSHVSDSNQEAEPAQLLDNEANKNLPVKKKTSCCTGLKVWCLISMIVLLYARKCCSRYDMPDYFILVHPTFSETGYTLKYRDG